MKTYGNASAPPERGTFFRLEIYIRVRKLHLESLTYDLFKVSQTKKIISHKTLIYFFVNFSYNPSNIFARARLVKMRHVTQYAPTKIGEYPSDIPQFK